MTRPTPAPEGSRTRTAASSAVEGRKESASGFLRSHRYGQVESGQSVEPGETRSARPRRLDRATLQRFERLAYGVVLILVLTNTLLTFLPLQSHPVLPALLLVFLFPIVAVSSLWLLNRFLIHWLTGRRMPVLVAFAVVVLANLTTAFSLISLFFLLPYPFNYGEFSGLPLEVVSVRMTLLGLLTSLAIWALHFARNLQDETEANAALARAHQQASLELLEQQVDPHFLMNSLTALQMLIREGRPEAEDYLLRLSRIYRNILERREENTSTLAAEFAFIEDYLALMNLRWEEAISLQVDVPDSRYHLQLPSFALQLLLENAIRHNHFSSHDPLWIHCEWLSEGPPRLRISNPLRPRARPRTTRAGLRNLRDRYALLGQGALFDFGVKGSRFEVILPLKESA